MPSFSVNGGTQFQGQNLDFRAGNNLAVSYSAGKVTYVDSTTPVYNTVTVPSGGGFYGGTVQPGTALVSVPFSSTPGSCVPGGLYYHTGLQVEVLCLNDAVTLQQLGFLGGISVGSTFFTNGFVAFSSPDGSLSVVADVPSETVQLQVAGSQSFTSVSANTRLGAPSGSSPPGTCTTGDLFVSTSGSVIEACTATDTWSTTGPTTSFGALTYSPSGGAVGSKLMATYFELPLGSQFVTVYLRLSSGNPFATTATGGSYWTATIPSSTFYPHTPSSTGQTSAQYVVGKCTAGSDFDYVYGQVLVGGTVIQLYIYDEFCTPSSYDMSDMAFTYYVGSS